MSNNDLRVGFIAWEPNYGAPGLHAAAAGPPPGSYQIGTIGGPRTLLQIQAEIVALEKYLSLLKSEMSGHPDYRRYAGQPVDCAYCGNLRGDQHADDCNRPVAIL